MGFLFTMVVVAAQDKLVQLNYSALTLHTIDIKCISVSFSHTPIIKSSQCGGFIISAEMCLLSFDILRSRRVNISSC